MGPVKIARREWLWAVGWALAVMALTTAPYLVGLAAQTSDWRFGGFLIGVEDSNSYLAKMSQSARGQWLFTPVYSTEPQSGVLLYSFYFLLGRLTGSDHTAQLLGFHAARVVGGVLALLASYRFLAEFLPFVRQRRLGLGLVALGGGLGWLLVLLGQRAWLGSLPVDFYSPEAYTFLSLFALPHLAFSRAFFLLGMIAYLRGQPARAGLAWLGVSLIQPIHVLALWAIVVVDAAWRLRAPGRGVVLRRAAVALILSAPVVLYTIAAFSLSPVLSNWNTQSNLPAAPPPHYLLGYGLWIAPGVFGWRALRRRSEPARWIAAWLIVAPVLLYWPLPIQRRLVEGVQLPLVILGVLGLTVGLRRARRWLTPLVVAASSLTALFLVGGAMVVARQPAAPVFHAADQLAVFRWVAAQPDASGGGLGAYATGNLIPVYTPLPAYLGLTTETAFFTAKQAQVADFFQAGTSAAARREWLSAGRIRYVFFGPAERALGDFDPDNAPYLRRRFAVGAYAVYEVVP